MRNILTSCLNLLLLSICLCFMSAAAAAEPADLKVMSFNVRYSTPGHSEDAPENNWNDAKHPRRERAIRIIRDNDPDLLGVQEARDHQVKDLQKAFPQYEFYGVGRDDGKTSGEFSGVFYRKGRFTRKDAGSFWLSSTPDKPGTTFSFNGLPRIASWVVLEDAKNSRTTVFLNQHWDHQDAVARDKSAALVRERLTKQFDANLPLIVIGDLNSSEDTKAFHTLLGGNGQDRKLLDSYRELHPERLPNESSFNDWKGKQKGSRIDFILHTDDLKPVAAEIDRTSYDGLWPSDHYPVMATLRFAEQKN